MDFSDLLFVIVFIGIIVANIVKQSKKKTTPAGSQPADARPGWKKILDDIIKDVREQMEQSAGSGTERPRGRTPGWEDILPAEKDESHPPAEPDPRMMAGSHPRPVLVPVNREDRMVTPEREARIKRIEELRLKKGKVGVMPAAVQQSGMTVAPEDSLSIEDLKNAMIWHEILSPPLGLREFI